MGRILVSVHAEYSPVTKRPSECAAVELKNGFYRLIKLTWDRNAPVGTFDYYHAAVERDGRWNAEFYDETGRSIWVYGSEDTLEYDWILRPPVAPTEQPELVPKDGIDVVISDVDFSDVPPGTICQTVEERDDGVPRHWKNWRIV